MSKIQEFLIKNKNINELTTQIALSQRIVDEKGEPLLFTIKGITASTYEEIRNQYSVFDKTLTNSNINTDKFKIALILEATVDPNFKDEGSIKAVGVLDGKSYIENVLLLGEIEKLATKILEFNGFER